MREQSLAPSPPSSETAQGALIVARVIASVQLSRSRGVISTESPEPGYIVVSPCLSPIPLPAPSTLSSDLSPSLAIPMASAVTKRRQLAPTVGQAEASTGVLIWTGPSSSSSARCASGLVFRHGVFDYVIDYASQFGAEPLPPGVILPVGSHCIFIADLPGSPLPTRGCLAVQGGRA